MTTILIINGILVFFRLFILNIILKHLNSIIFIKATVLCCFHYLYYWTIILYFKEYVALFLANYLILIFQINN